MCGLNTDQDATSDTPEAASRRPCFKCGPIPTGKGESVSGCVWANTFHAPDREYTIHSIQVTADYFSEKDGIWKTSSGFRPSQMSALEFVLRRCGDYVFNIRDAQQKKDEEIPI